jgi:hypothetical protein
MIAGSFVCYGRVGEQITGLNLSKSSPSSEFESMTNILFVDEAIAPQTARDHDVPAGRGPGKVFGATKASGLA